MVEVAQRLQLEEVLNEKQIHHVLEQAIGDDIGWKLEGSEVKPAADGIAGFLGEHLKAVLHVDVKGEKEKVHVFIKRVPTANKGKAKFIEEQHFFKKEAQMFKILENFCKEGSKPWCVKAYLTTDSMLVLPDLSIQGYTSTHHLHTLDLQHIIITTTTLARFHAASINYETKKSKDLNRPYKTSEEFGDILIEAIAEPEWLCTCCKLSTNLLKTFSTKPYSKDSDLESKITDLFFKAVDNLTEYEGTINVILHRDLWVNNIMFKYENDVPVNAVLVDYQLLRYGPPAFDIMVLLYLTTDKSFREEREKDIFDHYYSVFVDSLSNDAKVKLNGLGYDKDNFLKWCERARMFAMLIPIAIFPFILMDPKTAQKVYDDPETFDTIAFGDRSEPVIEYAKENEIYKQRNLTIIEEMADRYMMKK